ncbi:hypothetical protein D915_002433 [Fasciola hepatica]|uniref:Uncharacterized protein n=1 Tax=Fasciola hepatica TaxID=6192 RepID=A0A4E0RVY7_FASHE|nr:hypothetical protein D915_002433 [Fasciola hepatica]
MSKVYLTSKIHEIRGSFRSINYTHPRQVPVEFGTQYAKVADHACKKLCNSQQTIRACFPPTLIKYIFDYF